MVKTLKRLWPAMAVPCLLFCLATAVPAQARAEEDFQKLEDVLRHAWRGNPRIQAAREELRGKYELVPQARAGWKPTAEASANVTKAWLDGDNFGGGGSTSKQLGVTMSEPLYRGGRTVAATRSARATVTAQTALLNDAEQQLMLEVATAYMDVLRAGAQLRLAENYKTLIGRQLDGSRARFRAGDATMTDVSQGEARGAEADALIAAARGNLNKSGAVYAGLTGLQPGTMGYPQLSFAFPPTRDAAVEQARRDNPVIVASRSLQEASEADIDTIFGELLPRLALNGSWDRQYDPQPGLVDKATARSVALVLTVPLYEAGATRSRVRQAKHEANRRYLALLSAGRDAERQTVESWEELTVARATIKARAVQAEASDAALTGVHRETELGTRTILDELDAGQAVLNARTALIAARRDEIVAEFSLARSLGLLTPESLGFGGIAADHAGDLARVQDKILGMDVELEKADY